MSTFVIDLIIQTEVATPVYSHVDILDAVEKTLRDDLRPAFPGKAVAFRYTPTSPLPAGAATLTDKHLVGVVSSPLPAGAATLTDKHLVAVVFEVDDLRLLNNGYIKRYNPYPDSPAAAAKYEKHIELKGLELKGLELKGHELKYEQAKCAAAKEKAPKSKSKAKASDGFKEKAPKSKAKAKATKRAKKAYKLRANQNNLKAENQRLKAENARLKAALIA